ncbi:hypothetical protein, partial [Stenotrophomonas sp. PS02289]|uniref:hypothetical protein n=1 Tax=Stenotrophomonas sp. PS02289 TaxID=2991422 RepID=UPI00249A808B
MRVVLGDGETARAVPLKQKSADQMIRARGAAKGREDLAAPLPRSVCAAQPSAPTGIASIST